MNTPVRVDQELGYILHARAYRETSQLLEVFTPEHGRIGLMAKGSRRPKSPMRGIFSPFQPVRLSWSGRGDLPVVRDAEMAGYAKAPAGEMLMAGFYVNELIMKLLQRNDPHPHLFAHYASLISELAGGDSAEKSLRAFELELLREIGYALNLSEDAVTQEPLAPGQLYEFRVEQGAVAIESATATHNELCFTGRELLAIEALDLENRQQLHAAKRLLRYVLNYHLGGKALETRRIANAMQNR